MVAEAGVHFDDAMTPEGMRLYAIGDIHGCHDLMAEMHRRIMAEIMQDRPQDWRIIYMGDYVDRGPASRQVIDFLAHATESDPRVIALAGNHDIGFLSFLSEPRADSMFAAYGGEATARSYGIEIEFHPPEALERGHAALRNAIPEEHMKFLHRLKLSVTFGDFFFSHAGIRPGIPLDAQSPGDLVWIRERFLTHTGLHPKLVVHGHTPAATPELLRSRINLDTGAFRTGRLTGMMFEGRLKRLMEVTRSGEG